MSNYDIKRFEYRYPEMVEWVNFVIPRLYDESLSLSQAVYSLKNVIVEIAGEIERIDGEWEKFQKEVMKYIKETLKEEIYDWLGDGKLEDLIKEAVGDLLEVSIHDKYTSVVNPKIQTYGYLELLKDLANLECQFGDIISVITIGKSALGRDIKGVLIGDMSAQYKSMILSGEHAKELINAQLNLRQIEFICRNWDNVQPYTNRKVKETFKDSCMLFIPMQNPDGVELVVRGFDSIPKDTPDRNGLINKIKFAVEEYVRDGFQKYACFRDDWIWWDKTEDMPSIGGLVMARCPSYVFDENDLYIWTSNLEGIDLYLNKYSDATFGNYASALANPKPRGYTQGEFRAAFDIGTSGWNATENKTIKNFLYSNGFMQYVICMHNGAPHIAFNFSIGKYLGRGYEITREIAYESKTAINSSVFTQISIAGEVYSQGLPTCYCAVMETGYLTMKPNGNLSRNTDRAVTRSDVSPFPNDQEPYVFQQNKQFLIMWQEKYVREMDFYWDNDVLTKTEVDYVEVPKPILCASTASGALDLNQKANLNNSSRIAIRRIGKKVIVDAHVNVNDAGTINTSYDNVMTIYHNQLPRAKSGSIPRYFGIVGTATKAGTLRKNTVALMLAEKNYITFKTFDETGTVMLSTKDLAPGTTIAFSIEYYTD